MSDDIAEMAGYDEIETESSTALVPATASPARAVTAAQAKVEAVAHLTMSAYEKASTLQLTKEEIEGLKADFPDDAFRRGAGGKNNLIYIEHASLRDRLNTVIGIGQWSLIPRNRWADEREYTDDGGQVRKIITIYVEAMLLVRGCFVSEAVGDMAYYPHNAQTNYGDAVEGAKTQALRRCCKEFGIGLQAWRKDWGEEWKRRNPEGKPRPQQRQQHTNGHSENTPAQHLETISRQTSLVKLDEWRVWCEKHKFAEGAKAVHDRAGWLINDAAMNAKSPEAADEAEAAMRDPKWGLIGTTHERDIKQTLKLTRGSLQKAKV